MCLLLHQGCLKIVLLIPLSAHTDTPRSLVLPDGVHQSGHYPPAIGTFGNAWEEILRRKQVPPRVLRISSLLRDYGIHGSYTPSDDGHSESTQSSFSSPPSLTSEDGMSHPSQREACVNNIYLPVFLSIPAIIDSGDFDSPPDISRGNLFHQDFLHSLPPPITIESCLPPYTSRPGSPSGYLPSGEPYYPLLPDELKSNHNFLPVPESCPRNPDWSLLRRRSTGQDNHERPEIRNSHLAINGTPSSRRHSPRIPSIRPLSRPTYPFGLLHAEPNTSPSNVAGPLMASTFTKSQWPTHSHFPTHASPQQGEGHTLNPTHLTASSRKTPPVNLCTRHLSNRPYQFSPRDQATSLSRT
jgi:hypothetical protein